MIIPKAHKMSSQIVSPSKNSPVASRGILWLCALAFALVGLNWAVPRHFDADTALQTIMSTQRVTLFYWGQDRFLNFFPFVLAGISKVRANMFAHMYLMGACFFLLLEFLAHHAALLARSEGTPHLRALLFFSFVLASILVLGKPGIYVFAYSSQPYASSFLFMAWSASCILYGRQFWVAWLAGTALMLVAMGLNPSVLIVCAALCAYLLVKCREPRAISLGILALLAFAYWQHMSKLVGLPFNAKYSSFTPALVIAGWGELADNFNSFTGKLWGLTTLLLLSVVLLACFRRKGWWRSEQNIALSFLALFSLGWLALFLASDWVAMNRHHFRYFFPLFLSTIVIVGMALADLALRVKKAKPAVRLALVALPSLLLIAAPIAHVRKFDHFDAYYRAATYADQHGVRIVAGDYWHAWNVVWLLNAMHDNQRPRALVYGAAERGIVMRPQMSDLIHTNELMHVPTTALCIGGKLADCAGQLNFMTGYHWQWIEAGDCVDGCALFTTVRDE